MFIDLLTSSQACLVPAGPGGLYLKRCGSGFRSIMACNIAASKYEYTKRATILAQDVDDAVFTRLPRLVRGVPLRFKFDRAALRETALSRSPL